MSNQNQSQNIQSWLNFFFAIPEVKNQAYPKSPIIDTELGLLIPPKAAYAEQEIQQWIKDNSLTGEQLNKSFYKSWQSLKEKSDFNIRLDQIMHYLSTYGLQSLGLYNEDLIYIPEELGVLPPKVGFKVVKTLTNEEAIKKCISILEQGVALKQETIIDILNILEDCKYEFTPKSLASINNREAMVLIADKTGILPSNGEDLFRYIFYKSTSVDGEGGSTLVINDKNSKQLINLAHYALPTLSEEQLIELSKSYQRRKSLWLAIKTANRDSNASVVNKLNKLSKVYHQPLPKDVIGSLTSEIYTQQEVIEAANKATAFRLVKAIQALRLYASQPRHYFYSIRNGKSWYTPEECNTPKQSKELQEQYKKYEEWLLTILKLRLKDIKVYAPSNIEYTLPTSEKQFLGPIPYGTKIKPFIKEDNSDKSQAHLLLGIYWEGNGVDFDLSCNSVSTKVGWNGTYRSDDKGILHSGDITSAPNGATEWLYAKGVGESYLVDNTLYSKGGLNDDEAVMPYKLILAYGDEADVKECKKSDKYLVDPNKVLLEVDLDLKEGTTSLGILNPDLSFQLLKGGTGTSRVSSYNPALTEAILSKLDNLVYVKDIFTLVDSPEDCDVDLSLDKLDMTTFLNLLEDKD